MCFDAFEIRANVVGISGRINIGEFLKWDTGRLVVLESKMCLSKIPKCIVMIWSLAQFFLAVIHEFFELSLIEELICC